jgi:hypothetical protein
MLDEGPGFSRFPELPRNLFSENGRGLYIVATLAEEFAVTRREQHGSHARVVLSVRRSSASIDPKETVAWSPDADRGNARSTDAANAEDPIAHAGATATIQATSNDLVDGVVDR